MQFFQEKFCCCHISVCSFLGHAFTHSCGQRGRQRVWILFLAAKSLNPISGTYCLCDPGPVTLLFRGWGSSLSLYADSLQWLKKTPQWCFLSIEIMNGGGMWVKTMILDFGRFVFKWRVLALWPSYALEERSLHTGDALYWEVWWAGFGV